MKPQDRSAYIGSRIPATTSDSPSRRSGTAYHRDAAFRPARHEIVLRLEVQPELRRGAEGLVDQPGRLGACTAPSLHDLVDLLHRRAYLPGEGDLGKAEWVRAFHEQDFAGMDRETRRTCGVHARARVAETAVIRAGGRSVGEGDDRPSAGSEFDGFR